MTVRYGSKRKFPIFLLFIFLMTKSVGLAMNKVSIIRKMDVEAIPTKHCPCLSKAFRTSTLKTNGKDGVLATGIILAIPMERGIIFHTTDSGETWQVELKSPQNLNRFGYANGHIWVVGDNGAVYYTGKYAVTSLDKQFTTWGKMKTTLFQSYPNPFNPDTWIPYQLAEDNDVTIRIYNIKGKPICTLRLGEKQAGSYITQKQAAYWDGRNDASSKVASGIYFYTLRAGDFAATKKLVIMK